MDYKLQTAPCGLDCFNCIIHKRNITKDYKKMLAENLNVPINEVACRGCKIEKGNCRVTKNCEIWECTQNNRVSFCYECRTFPCVHLLPTQKGAEFPHNMKLYNLCRIKLVGIENWVKEVPDIRKRYHEGKYVSGKGAVLDEEI